MHEFSLCQSLLKEALKLAPDYFYKQQPKTTLQGQLVIAALTVRISLFSGVDKHLMQRAFAVALHDFHRYWPTHCDDPCETSNVVFAPFTQLFIEEAPVIVYCQQCDQNFAVDKHQYRQRQLTCLNNAEHSTQLLSGDEILLINLKMHLENEMPPLSKIFQNQNPARG